MVQIRSVFGRSLTVPQAGATSSTGKTLSQNNEEVKLKIYLFIISLIYNRNGCQRKQVVKVLGHSFSIGKLSKQKEQKDRAN
jgi:hypothetical protein